MYQVSLRSEQKYALNQRQRCENGQICVWSAYICSDLNETWYTQSPGHAAHMLLMTKIISSNFHSAISVAHCDIWKKNHIS